MAICPLAYVAIFSGQLSFCRIYYCTLLQSNCAGAAVLWSRYFFRAAVSFELLLFENSHSSQQLFFQKQLIFWWKNCLEWRYLQKSYFFKAGTSANINFFRRATLWKKLFFEISNILHYLLFLEELAFHSSYFCKIGYLL